MPADFAIREVALAQARALARAGRYAEAEELLGEAGQDVAVLDLKARVHAQRGQFEEAERCWTRVAELDPGNDAAVAGLRRIAVLRAKSVSNGSAMRYAVRGGAALVVVLALVALAAPWEDDPVPVAAPTAPPSPSPSSSPEESDVLAELRLERPGVRVQRLPKEITVTFGRGLFKDGATLSADGRRVVTDLGKRLRPHGERITIAVIGHTDRSALRPGGEYASNVELGTIRATVVREVLRSSAQMPTARFSVSTLAGMFPPHPGDGPGDTRNRTVSLRISAVGGR